MAFKIAVVVLLLGAALAEPLSELEGGRIVGGTPAKRGQFPHQVSIVLRGRHHCGGAIIGRRWILTAAHCVHKWNIKRYEVVVGTTRWNSTEATHTVAEIIRHPRYSFLKSTYDIALLKLSSPIQYNYCAKPIHLALSATQGGDSCVLSGWGMTSFPSTTPTDLHYIQLKSISVDECKREFPMKITESNVCTYKGVNQGGCIGDEGGPLICKGVLHGVMSWFTPCARDKPDVFTSVAFFRRWILTNTNA